MKKYRARESEEHIDESWLIPYADLLTLLLALFIVLFASSQLDQSKFEQLSQSFNMAFRGGDQILLNSGVAPVDIGHGRSRGEDSSTVSKSKDRQTEEAKTFMEKYDQETKDLQELKEKLDIYITENGLGGALGTELDTEQLKIKISDSALFDSGSATIRTESRKIAVTISELLVQSPEYQVVIAGHTDNVPINTREFPSNWELSSKRALNFMKILLQNDQLSPERFSAVGYGEYQPVASNDNARDRALNRRVEVSIMRNFQVQKDASSQ